MKPAFLIIFSALLFFSCKKNSFITSGDASLYTSSDSLFFDTVFTASGSVTQSFKIFNNNEQKLQLSQVKLAGGSASPFKINIDGVSASEVNDIGINANDSIYVFVQVNVNPSGATLPFILSDSIVINYNGNQQVVQLQAYGQNAVFMKKARLTGNVSWNSNLPYVILGGLQIDTNATLHIAAGTKIYLHADAPFLVDGTLIANGTRDQPVIFSGDRLDAGYKDLPASWPGIYLRGASKNNLLQHSIIRNAYQGIVAQELSLTPQPKLTLSRCIIDNIFDVGILGINTNIGADNCLISNCGSNVQFQGGDYRFTNCTIASYNNNYISHKNAVLQVSDIITHDGGNTSAPLNAIFANSILWGEGGAVDDEIIIEHNGADPFSVNFDHSIYKAKNEIENATFTSCLKNEPPLFDAINTSKNIYDFHFNNDANAPSINAGSVTSFPYDLDDKLRDAMPDIGCYER